MLDHHKGEERNTRRAKNNSIELSGKKESLSGMKMGKNDKDRLTCSRKASSDLDSGMLKDVHLNYKQVLSMDPTHEGALCGLAEVYRRLGKYDEAVDCYKQSIRYHPEHYRTRLGLGDTYQIIGRSDAAAHAYAAALKFRPDDPDIIVSLALALTRLGKKEQALIFYQKALSCRPGDYTLYNQYATVLEKCNRLSDARKAIEISLSLHPDNVGAVVNLATIEYREGNYERALQLFSQLDLNGKTFEAAATIKQQEGLALDKLGRYPEAFDCFQKSNQLNMQTPAYRYLKPDYEKDLKRIKRLAARFSTDIMVSWKQSHVETVQNPPVFLVGFPRSGTTLMEQVLNSHPGITTLDERSPLQRIVDTFGTVCPSSHLLRDISAGEIAYFREEYFGLLKKRADVCDEDLLIVDKLPLNILHLHLIYRFFPDARIVVALRHPLDCILSNFIQRFKLNKKMMNFLTLDDSAHFYALTMGLFLQYRDTIPMAMHEIRYESLTENIEKETKSLTAFLEVEWSPTMMKYHREAAKRIINTPSYTEVIKPIHRKAVHRWKNYREQLACIIPIVEGYIDRFGYSGKI